MSETEHQLSEINSYQNVSQKHLILKKNDAYHVIKSNDIICIESSGNYVNIVTEENKFIYRSTLKSFLKRLDPNSFFRIHRCTIVNIDHVERITNSAYGDYEVILTNKAKLKMTRNYRSMFQLY